MISTPDAVMDFIHRDLKGAVKKLYHPPLIEIARWWRGRLAHPHFIGVTGSAGKTTTKDLLYATLRQRFCSVSSVDSNNQLYNIARTLLTVSPRTASGSSPPLHPGRLVALLPRDFGAPRGSVHSARFNGSSAMFVNVASPRGLLGATRLAPAGSPCGRSPPLRGVVEPRLHP